MSFLQGYSFERYYQLGKKDAASGGFGVCPNTTAENMDAYDQGFHAGKSQFGGPASSKDKGDGPTLLQQLQKDYDDDWRIPSFKDQDPKYAPLKHQAFPEEAGGPDNVTTPDFSTQPSFPDVTIAADSIGQLFGGLFD